MGTPDLGTAAAGRAALAQDAATVFGNPAGMTRLDRSQLLIGTQLVVGDVHFDRGPDTTVAGGNGLTVFYGMAKPVRAPQICTAQPVN